MPFVLRKLNFGKYENFKYKKLYFYYLFDYKVIFYSLIVPSIQDVWFIDFIKNSINNPSLDPWSNYLLNYGDSLGFPYGPIMFLIFIPFSLIFWTLGLPFGLEDYFLGIGFRSNLLIFDLISLLVLSKLLDNKKKKLYFSIGYLH